MSTDTDRDRSIDHLLRRAIAERADGGPSPRCLDAETLAAWMDGGLSESERASAEAHASECVHCQAALAVLARAAAPPEPPAPWWRRPWHLGWMVPLAAGAAALALWVAVPERPTPQATAARQPAVADRSTLTDAAQPLDALRQAPPAAAALEKQEVVAPARQDALKKELARETERDERTAAGPSSNVAATGAAKTSEAPATAAPPGADQAAAPAVGPSAAQAQAAAAQPAETRTRNERALDVSSSLRSFRTTVALDGSTRWRVASAGVVQRSTDGGSTWESLPTGATSELLAVSSPSATVCWVVGRGGTVLLAVDGRRFVRVAPPVAADLAAVRATDERAASVTTADGRTFRTENGGMSWTEVR